MAKMGERESAILSWIAAHSPATVGEVAAEFGQSKGLARTTLLTVMERLRVKGFLTREKVEGIYRYAPSEPHNDQLRDLVGRFVERSLGGSLEPFVAYLSKDARLTEIQKEQLRQLLQSLDEDDLRSEAVTQEAK
ncbi:BlaI/MecI/CopY family transcriptional regulator [bacterium]|nr:MAG: BlaI/MecI/CopY family transcriptional regulator [bacterium]